MSPCNPADRSCSIVGGGACEGARQHAQFTAPTVELLGKLELLGLIAGAEREGPDAARVVQQEVLVGVLAVERVRAAADDEVGRLDARVGPVEAVGDLQAYARGQELLRDAREA